MTKDGTRAPPPTAVSHTATLLSLSFRRDLRKPKLYFLKWIIMPLLLMLYTMGFFISFMSYGDDNSNTTVVDGYRLFAEEGWTYPSVVRVGAADRELLSGVAAALETRAGDEGVSIESLNATTAEEVKEMCSDISDAASDEVCAYLSSDSGFEIYYGGKQAATPYQAALSGAQHLLSKALLDVSGRGTQEAYPAETTQRTPQLLDADTVSPNVSLILVPGIMYGLSLTIVGLFVGGTVVNERTSGVIKSYLLVGVRTRTYLVQWVVYCAINSAVMGGLLTLVCVYWGLMPQSSAGLIYVSNYLGLVQYYTAMIVVCQFVNQAETAGAVVWLTFFLSAAVGSAILVLQSAQSLVLTVLSAFLPIVGQIQYIGIYASYDYSGYGTGIHGRNLVESGMLYNMIAQACGVAFWMAMIAVYSSSRTRRMVASMLRRSRKNDQVVPSTGDQALDESNFEPINPGKEVLLSVKGLRHTYYPTMFQKNEPVTVLKGLNLELCRGEVFGYLGHNGSGKSTSVSILSTELEMEAGDIRYQFRNGGAVPLGDASANDDLVREKIGVCPQSNDSLQEDLTARETLMLFARLKGRVAVGDGQSMADALKHEVECRLAEVKFTNEEDKDKPVGTFSGGMKRKVLIAVALLGDPEVVFLDEPTAGLDPYNRRIVWDVIAEAKAGRSIVLTTHFLDEADVLSDRIGILKNGRLISCGSSLFLKHTLGAGYSLKWEGALFQVTNFVDDGNLISSENNCHEWSLPFGCEKCLPDLLLALSESGAKDIDLKLTTLEDVFLKTGSEEFDDEADDVENTQHDDGGDTDIEAGDGSKDILLSRAWDPRAPTKSLSFFQKLRLVESFVRTNAMKMKGSIALNISIPLIYLVVGLVVVSLIEVPPSGETVSNAAIQVSSPWTAGGFFGVKELTNRSIAPLQPMAEPESLADYFSGSLPALGGIFSGNETLQYAPNVDGFALQFGVAVLANYSSWLAEEPGEGISASVQQLPYVLDNPFRFDLLFLPMMLSFGFAGLAFSVLDVLLLKDNKTIDLFRVVGITEWLTYLGVTSYKALTTFSPFFVVLVVLGASIKSVLFGNAGRWLATLLICFAFAFSGTPISILMAKKFIRSSYKEATSWFPGVYYTLIALPYVAWSSALQAAPSARTAILIAGDVLSIFPYFAFQRGLAGVIASSAEFHDPTLSWSNVWSFDSRIWYCILLMTVAGLMEWYYLYRLAHQREPKTELSEDETREHCQPVDVSNNVDLFAEVERSVADDEGINARELVKTFIIHKKIKDVRKKQRVIKQAVKGVSLGIRQNELYALLGPNGAGKSTAINILASQFSPDRGEVALAGRAVSEDDIASDSLYESGKVAFCFQEDALFEKKTVDEHIEFYATIRGLNWEHEETQNHLDAIVKLLSLEKHRSKASSELSGGFKRRLCLALSMIGYPDALVLDEPTTGLDPSARRHVWDVLKPKRNGFDVPAILMSSHNMEECQQGTRIGIMINGEMVTTGSFNRLKDLYCNALFVEIALSPDITDCSASEKAMLDAFAGIDMKAEVYESLPYRFKLRVALRATDEASMTTQLAEAFRLLEDRKTFVGIHFYSVSPLSLEQIFINLSRKQFEADEEGLLSD